MKHVKVCKVIEKGRMEMRSAYCNALIKAAEENPRIVSIDCDLSNSCGTGDFRKAFPDRFFNIGIQEQNGAAMAGGMSATGLIPFFHSFAVFSSRRIYDQVFLSCAYGGENVKIVGCDAGVSAAFNGGTHMAFEDMGIMRVMPHITVLEATDPVMMTDIVKKVADLKGVVYLRMPRKEVDKIYEDDSTFEIGKGVIVRDGTDVTIIANGMEVAESIKAADMLEKEGISARVVDMFTLKPLDVDLVVRCAKETGAIVTAENCSIIGGLGSAVAEAVVENCPVPVERVGVEDEFGEVGPVDYLMERFGLTSSHIVSKVKDVLRRRS